MQQLPGKVDAPSALTIEGDDKRSCGGARLRLALRPF
jgi:hypothetical protein